MDPEVLLGQQGPVRLPPRLRQAQQAGVEAFTRPRGLGDGNPTTLGTGEATGRVLRRHPVATVL